MTHYLRTGSVTKVVADTDLIVNSRLTAKNYILAIDPHGEYFLKDTEPFSRPHRYYGDVKQRAVRVLDTFLERPRSTGVLLQGLPGTGKTLLAREISIKASEIHGIPTILINEEFYGDKFCAFISSIDQPCVVIFDEFEKIYDRDAQNRVLTLFDGTYTQKKLFLVTVNDSYNLISPFLNRPGRLYYNFTYSGLDEGFIREYVNENLINKDHIDGLFSLMFGIYSGIAFDGLSSIVEEMNRYGEDAGTVVSMMNIAPSSDLVIEATVVSSKIKNAKVTNHNMVDLYSAKSFNMRLDGTDKKKEHMSEWFEFDMDDVTGFDKETGIVTLEFKDHYEFGDVKVMLRQTNKRKLNNVMGML